MRNKIKSISGILICAVLLMSFNLALAEENSTPTSDSTSTSPSTSTSSTDKSTRCGPDTSSTSTTKDTRGTTKPRMLDRKCGLSNQNQGTEETRAKRVMESKRKNVMKLMDNQITRSSRAIERLKAIIAKIEARRNKMEGQGLNVTSINALIETAKEQKEAAEGALKTAKEKKAALEGLTDIDSLRTATKEFMDAMRDLQKKLIALHKSLMNIVKEMRKVERAAKPKDETEEGEEGEETPPPPPPAPTPTSNQEVNNE